jgi:hypothetical protein
MPAPVLQFKRGNAGVAGTVPALRPGEPAISLNNFDFFIGIDTSVVNNKFFGSHRYWGREDGTTSLRVKLVDKDGTNSINLKSPNTLAGITTYTLPATPTNGFVLTTNADGDLSWTNSLPGASFSGITTFTNTTDNTLGNADTGAVQIDGGLGINKNLTVGQNLHVQGFSNFVGVVTFQGGTINLGDDTGDNINIGGEFVSGLYPNTTATYDLGDGTRQWRHGNFSGIVTASTGAVVDGVQIGINGANVIDTVSGNLTLNSAGGQTIIDDLVTIQNNLTVNGNVTVGGTTVTLRGTDVFIENKDIVLGYTTSITPSDTTANHAGVAIASTEGTPLVNFDASGINTLPSTYKQMMWFKSGTLGFSTDAFGFNYGVAIGTTTMANGIRLAVGSGITMTDTAISATTVNATTGNFTNLSGSLTGTISTATRANTVDTIQRSTNATHYLTFVTDDNASATAEAVYTDAGITYNPSTNNLTVSGDLAINGGDATTTATTFNLVNATATSVNFGGAATALNLGATTGIATINNATLTLPNATTVNVNGANPTFSGTSTGTLTFFNTNLTSVNSFGAATSLVMGATTGITTVRNKLVVIGNLEVDGNNIQASDGNTNITLTSNTLTTFAGDIRVNGNDIQASDGNTNITMTSNTLTEVKGDLQVTGNDIKSSTGANAISLSGSDVTVNGNLYVNGSTTQVNTAALTVEDRTIDLGIVNGTAPAADTTWDLGVLFNYYSSGAAKKSAVVWEHGDSRFKFASVLASDTDGSNNNTPQLTVTTFAPIEIGALWVNDCAGQSQVISCTGTTRYLENITIDAGQF